nr:nucleotidyltransferase family protein [Actinomycetota bacterium]
MLDLSGRDDNLIPIDLMVLSTLPSEPMGLQGEVAGLWRRLAEAGPVDDDDLSSDERLLVREFAEAGVASADPAHPARATRIRAPWFSSPLHELVCALVASVARDNGIRFVFIKGPVLHLQGLRDREHSGDIDLWVDPADIVRLSRLFEPWGWALVPNFWGDIAAYHAMTLAPRVWGCELDLHRHMPGCAAPDAEAFRVLAENSSALVFAGVDALVPSRTANAVLSALHFTRPHPEPNPPVTVTRAVEVLQRAGAGAIGFSDAVKATAALEPVLRQAFPDAEVEADHRIPLNWRWRAESNTLRRAVLASRSVPVSSWPRFVGRLFWPEEDIAMRFDHAHGAHAKSAVGARLRRLVYGVKGSFTSRRP